MQQIQLKQFVKDFQNGLNQAAGMAAAQLGKGQCADFSEYKAKVGFIRGLESAGQMAEQMLRSIEDAGSAGDSKLPEMNP